MPFGWGLWVWFKNNKAAQYAALTGVAIAAFWGWLTLRDRRRKREMLREIERKSEATARKVIDRAKEKTHETIKQADEARAAIPRGTPSGELPKPVQDILFDD